MYTALGRLFVTTVRLRDDDKDKLEKLRAMVTLSTGTKVTQEELLGTLIDDALARGERFLAETYAPRLPVSDQDFRKVLGLISDWGVETNSEEIDKFLYGTVASRARKK